MLVIALCIEEKLENQPRFTTTEEWTKKNVQIHKGFFFSLEEQTDTIFRHIDATIETLLINLVSEQQISYVFVVCCS